MKITGIAEVETVNDVVRDMHLATVAGYWSASVWHPTSAPRS
jgi:hypothetical protein